MCDIWVEKYKPKCVKDCIGNSNNILKFNNWIKNFDLQENKSIVVLGYHGIGKNIITKIILEENNYYYKWLDYKDEKAKNLFDDLINCYKGKTLEQFFKLGNGDKKFALVINDIDKITLKNEKARIKDLLKINSIEKLFPIIFISNMQHNKLLTDILDCSDIIKLELPKDVELLNFINKIAKKEKINLKDDSVKKKIIKFIQMDIRRLISVLYDLKSTFEDDEIDVDKFKLYKENSYKKCKDTSLFDASKDLINYYSDVNSSLSHYKVDKVLVPLTIHENFYKSLFNKLKKNKHLINGLKMVTDSISVGDVIETNIYTDQNWFLHDIHGFYTCSRTSYHINKECNLRSSKDIAMKFSSDLNQTSLKNINKKQITNLQKIFTYKSFNDIININKIIYNLVQEGKIYEVYEIMKDYDTNIKTIETLIKIDKTLPKLAISQKYKKLFNNYVKAKA